MKTLLFHRFSNTKFGLIQKSVLLTPGCPILNHSYFWICVIYTRFLNTVGIVHVHLSILTFIDPLHPPPILIQILDWRRKTLRTWMKTLAYVDPLTQFSSLLFSPLIFMGAKEQGEYNCTLNNITFSFWKFKIIIATEGINGFCWYRIDFVSCLFLPNICIQYQIFTFC